MAPSEADTDAVVVTPSQAFPGENSGTPWGTVIWVVLAAAAGGWVWESIKTRVQRIKA